MERIWFTALADTLGLPALAQLRLPTLAWMAVCGLLAVLLAFWGARRDGVPFGLKALGAIVAACVGGALGGHWIALAFKPEVILARPVALFLVFEGGFSSMGVYAGAAAGMGIYMRVRKLPFWTYADAFAPGTMVAAALARAACLLKGCDFGTVAPSLPWALRYPRGTGAFAWLEKLGLVGPYQRVGLPLHPFPAYEALPVLCVGALALIKPDAFGAKAGQRASGCAALYCLARLIAEHFRADTLEVIAGWTMMQAFCLTGAALFGICWWALGRTPTPAHPSTPASRPTDKTQEAPCSP